MALRTCYPCCPWCYVNAKGRGNYKGHSGYRAPVKRLSIMAIRKPSSPAPGAPSSVSLAWALDDEFRRRYPFLTAYLEDESWEDGSPRETATLLLFVESGTLKCCFNDRALQRSVFMSSRSLEGLLEGLDSGLESDTLDWRAKSTSQRRGKR